MTKIRIGLVFGGKSGEHEVSIRSAKSIYEALDKNKYDVVLIGIDKAGKWLLAETVRFKALAENPKRPALPYASRTDEILPFTKSNSTHLISPYTGQNLQTIDVFFPIIHGTYGEDGSIQGLFELLDTAYVGAGVLGSGVGMDKDVMKRLLQQNKIPVGKFKVLKKHEVGDTILNDVIKNLKLPLFVKPANLGSSVGVSKVNNREELQKAVHQAFQYDTKILIEEFIPGREVECSVLGNNSPIASLPGEIVPRHEFYSYEAKYIDENGAKLIIPAKIDLKTTKKIQTMAIKVFQTLECSGMARVDFFLTEKNKVIVNEINTLPGFTRISMYPKLWDASGISYRELLDRLINLAIEKKKEKDILIREYK